jgi:predicted transcriptional regulator
LKKDNGRVLGYDNAHGVHDGTIRVSFEKHALRTTHRQPLDFTVKSRASGEAMKIRVFDDGFEGHVRRSLARAKARGVEHRLPPETAITFADPMDLLECLSKERIRIVQTIRKRKLSVSSLAQELGRNRGSVTRDVNKLRKFGLLRLREQVNPGHGVVQIVEPVAEKIEMRVAI